MKFGKASTSQHQDSTCSSALFLILINKSSAFSICIIAQTGNLGLYQQSTSAWSYLHPGAATAAHTLSSPLAFFQANALAAPPLLLSRWLCLCHMQTCCSSLIHDIVPQPLGLISAVFTGRADCVSSGPGATQNTLYPHSIHMHKIARDFTHTALPGARNRRCWWRRWGCWVDNGS